MAIFKNIRTTGLAQASPLFNPRPFLYFDTSTYDNRENLWASSNTFDSSVWAFQTDGPGTVGITQNAIVSPENLRTGSKFFVATAGGSFYSIYRSATITANTNYTYSAYARAAEVSIFNLTVFTGTAAPYILYNLTTGLVSGQGNIATDVNFTLVGTAITDAGNGWYRASITFRHSLGGTFQLKIDNGSTTLNQGFFLYGAQLEASNYLSAYKSTENLMVVSEDFSQWAKNTAPNDYTVTANSTAAPNNTLTADLIIKSTGAGTSSISYKLFNGLINTLYCGSVFVKAGGYSKVQVAFGSSSFNNVNVGGNIDLTNGSVNSVINGSTVRVESVGNGWHRVSVTATSIGSVGNYVFSVTPLDNSYNANFAGDGVSGIYAWGAQVEKNGFATTYTSTSLVLTYPRPTTITDIGSSANNGVLQSGLYPDASGVFTFNGTSHNITTTTTYPTVNSTNFTLTGMFKTTVASGKKIVGFQSTQSGEVGASYDKNVYVDTSGKLVWGVYDGAVQVITSAITVNDGAWHHFAATHDFTNTKMELFVDGVSQGTINKRTNDGTTWLRIGSFYQGGWPGGLNGYWPGSLSHIGFYPGVFTAEQAQSHMYALRSNENIVKDRVILNIDANKVATVGQVVSRNLIPIPEAFNTGLWGSFCSNGDTSNMTYNTTEVAAPDGTFTATKVVRNNVTACGAGAGWGFLWQASNIFSVGQTYTVSVYARLAVGSNPAAFQLGLNDFHMLGVGSLTTSWQRYTVTRTIGSSSPNELDRGIQFISTDQNCSFYVWGAQMEPGSTMTTYYPQSTGASLAPLTTAQDISGNNNTATLQRSTYFTVNPNRFEIDASNISSNNGLFLSSTINIADTATYSVSVWIKSKTTPASTFHSIIGTAATSRWVGIEHNDTSGSNWRFFFRQLGGTYFNSTNFTYNISANWANITFTVDAARNVKVYLNGAYSQTLTPTTTELSISRIGAGYSSGGNFYSFNGAVSNCLVYSKTLSALEVKQNFDAQRYRFGI